MLFRQNNRRPVENFIVVKPSQALYNTGGAGNRITNTTTGAVVLADGQLGVFDASGMGSNVINTALTSGNTTAHSPSIFIAQGTEDSANPGVRKTSPLWSRPYERTEDIIGNFPIIATKQVYVRPTFSIWSLGAASGAGQINVVDNNEYQLRVVFRGTRVNMYNDHAASAASTYSFVSEDYTTLGLNQTQARDHIVHNLAWAVNKNSIAFPLHSNPLRGNDPVVAFAVDTTGASGVAIGGGSPIAGGDVIPTINTPYGMKNIVLTTDQAESIKAAAVLGFGDVIANVTWSIVPINLTTAGTGIANMILLMGWDADPVYDDKIGPVKTRLIPALTAGFSPLTALTSLSSASEGSGTGRAWDLLYRTTQGQRKYNLDHALDPVIEFPSPVNKAATYVSYVIEHFKESSPSTGAASSSPFRSIILIPSSETTLITAFDTLMNTWLTSASGTGFKAI
mgnify:CR=1 FL=1